MWKFHMYIWGSYFCTEESRFWIFILIITKSNVYLFQVSLSHKHSLFPINIDRNSVSAKVKALRVHTSRICCQMILVHSEKFIICTIFPYNELHVHHIWDSILGVFLNANHGQLYFSHALPWGKFLIILLYEYGLVAPYCIEDLSQQWFR